MELTKYGGTFLAAPVRKIFFLFHKRALCPSIMLLACLLPIAIVPFPEGPVLKSHSRNITYISYLWYISTMQGSQRSQGDLSISAVISTCFFSTDQFTVLQVSRFPIDSRKIFILMSPSIGKYKHFVIPLL